MLDERPWLPCTTAPPLRHQVDGFAAVWNGACKRFRSLGLAMQTLICPFVTNCQRMRVNETSFSNAPFRQGIVERTEIATRTVTVRVRTGLQSAFLFNQTTVATSTDRQTLRPSASFGCSNSRKNWKSGKAHQHRFIMRQDPGQVVPSRRLGLTSCADPRAFPRSLPGEQVA